MMIVLSKNQTKIFHYHEINLQWKDLSSRQKKSNKKIKSQTTLTLLLCT